MVYQKVQSKVYYYEYYLDTLDVSALSVDDRTKLHIFTLYKIDTSYTTWYI